MPERLVVILDGLGDRPVAALDGMTPLEAARTPNMNALASMGRIGLVDPVAPGVRVGTHVGAGLLMGLAPEDVEDFARGPVEAAGIGLDLGEGDVALRCNLATLYEQDGELFISDRRAGRVSKESPALLASMAEVDLGEGIRASVRPATEHRAVARLSGPGLSPAVANTDPGDAVPLPTRVNPRSPEPVRCETAARTARAVDALIRISYERLKDHPANRERIAQGQPPATGLITRSAGMPRAVRNRLCESGLRAAVISAESTVLGLGRLFGFTNLEDARFTASTLTDLGAKIQTARTAMPEFDIVFLHIKGTDLCAHDRLPLAKRDFIEQVDAALAPLLAEQAVIAITADHCTDSNTGAHTGDPVPSLLYVPGAPPGPRRAFGERDCRSGDLGRLTASQFLAAVLAAGATKSPPC